MQLYFIRHGAAVAAEEWSGSDATRPLTKAGKAQLRQVADTLAAVHLAPDHLLTNPAAADDGNGGHYCRGFASGGETAHG